MSALEEAIAKVEHDQHFADSRMAMRDCPRCALDRAKAEVDRLAVLLHSGKVGWMDSMAFDHELGHALGGNKVYPDRDDCRENHRCITESENNPSQHGYDCEAKRVVVFDANELDAALAPLERKE